MNERNILFVFGPGRIQKIIKKSYQANDFFYGYFSLNKKYNLNAIGATKETFDKKGIKKILHFYDRLIVKTTSFPSYSTEILTINNIKSYRESNVVIFTSDALFLSFLPIVFFYKLIGKKINNIVITMGMLGKPTSSKLKHFTNWLYLKIIFYSSNHFVFIGKGEYELAKKLYVSNSKIHYIPFSVDTEFWSTSKNLEKSGVLFVGNDGKRDYELLIKIVAYMKEIEFTFISNYEFNFSAKNLKIIKGSWSEEILTDEELRDYYTKSKLTILPIKETYQPSGQSVGLQSISCKTPILISKTKGFWGDNNFVNNYKVNFVKNNSVEEWSKSIIKILKNYKNFELSEKASQEFNKEFKIEKFVHNLEKLF